MPTIPKATLDSMMADVPDNQRDAFLTDFKRRGFTIAESGTGEMSTGQIAIEGLKQTAATKIPVLSQTADLLRHDVPDAFAEAGGRSGIPGMGVAGAAVGTIISLAGEMIPATVGEATLMGVSPTIGKGIGKFFGGVGRLGSFITGKVAAPFAESITPGASRAAAFGPLSPAEITGAKGPSVAESVLAESALGAGPIEGFRVGQVARMSDEARRMLGKYGKSTGKEELGLDLQARLSRRSQAASRLGARLYSHVDELLPEDNFIKLTNTSKRAQELLAKEQSLAPKFQNKELIGKLEELATAPGSDFASLNITKSEVGDLIRKADSGLSARGGPVKFRGSREGGVYKQIAGAMDDDMDTFFGSASPDLKAAYDAARSFWKNNRVLYDSSTVRKLSIQKPEALLRVIVRPKAVTEIKELRRVVGPQGMNNVKRAWLEDAFGATAQQEFGPTHFAKVVESYGKETLSALFDREEFEAISQLAHYASFVGRAQRVGGNPSGTARHLLNVASFSGAGLALWMHNPMSAAATLLSPRILAKMYLSPTGRKWLTTGLQIPFDAAKAGEAREGILKAAALVGGQALAVGATEPQGGVSGRP